jgi:hypothetical protein
MSSVTHTVGLVSLPVAGNWGGAVVVTGTVVVVTGTVVVVTGTPVPLKTMLGAPRSSSVKIQESGSGSG